MLVDSRLRERERERVTKGNRTESCARLALDVSDGTIGLCPRVGERNRNVATMICFNEGLNICLN